MNRAEEKVQAYSAMVRAVMVKLGGRIVIQPEEMPKGPYSIMWRPTPEGGLEAVLEESGSPQ
jgi:hypothetical protein